MLIVIFSSCWCRWSRRGFRTFKVKRESETQVNDTWCIHDKYNRESRCVVCKGRVACIYAYHTLSVTCTHSRETKKFEKLDQSDFGGHSVIQKIAEIVSHRFIVSAVRHPHSLNSFVFHGGAHMVSFVQICFITHRQEKWLMSFVPLNAFGISTKAYLDLFLTFFHCPSGLLPVQFSLARSLTLFVCLFVSLSVYLSVCGLHLFVYFGLSVSVYLTVWFCPSII